jgi:hypothetical protein
MLFLMCRRGIFRVDRRTRHHSCAALRPVGPVREGLNFGIRCPTHAMSPSLEWLSEGLRTVLAGTLGPELNWRNLADGNLRAGEG